METIMKLDVADFAKQGFAEFKQSISMLGIAFALTVNEAVIGDDKSK